MKTLTRRVAVVTGGASGIGYGIAERLLREGMTVILADVEAAALGSATAALGQHGTVVGHVCDVSDPESIATLVDRVVTQFRGVHVLCNSAGVEAGDLIADASPAVWEWVLSVNFGGALAAIRAFLPHLKQQDEAHIVNIASMAAIVGAAPATGPYAVSKAALLTLSETLDAELRDENSSVGVSVALPGSVRTRFNESARNRPNSVPEQVQSDLRQRVLEGIAKRQERAISPMEVADCVVAGMLADQLYVVTHPDMTVAAVRARADAITASAGEVLAHADG